MPEKVDELSIDNLHVFQSTVSIAVLDLPG